MHKQSAYFGPASLFLATFIYGFFGVLSRIIGFSLPLYYQSAVRSLVASLILLVLLGFVKQWKRMTQGDFVWVAVRSFFGIVAIITFFIAVNFLPIGTVYFIFYAGSTIGGYTLGKALFSEHLTPVKIISFTLALLGLYLIYSLSIDPSKVLYAIISLVSGVSTAFWNTLSKKISHTYSALQLSFLDNVIGALLAFIISIIVREQWMIPTATLAWGVNMIFACFYVATGQLVVYGFRVLDAQIGSLIMLAEVLFGILLGFVFYHEVVAPLTLLGGFLILVAIILPEINISKYVLVAPRNKRRS